MRHETPASLRDQKARTTLLLDHPFFGSLLFRLKGRESRSIKTMATQPAIKTSGIPRTAESSAVQGERETALSAASTAPMPAAAATEAPRKDERP